MIPIFGGINGQHLRTLIENAKPDTDQVLAAVAYATDDRLLFDWCWTSNIPLKFWGRYDHTVPVAIRILEKFLSRKSSSYQCKLVKHFHPKVIWWQGYGAYIGSANLTDAAWSRNVEAGCFFPEDEMIEQGLDLELTEFFRVIDEMSYPLIEETIEILKKRKNRLNWFDKDSADAKSKIDNAASIKDWAGLVTVSQKNANERGRQAFLDEWNSTLAHLRQIADLVGRPENIPNWIKEGTPASLIADQFLHAYYYVHTFDDKRANFEHYFDKHKSDPDAAVQKALLWWRDTKTAPMSEDEMLNVSAPRVGQLIHKDSLLNLSLEEWEEVTGRVHSMSDHARRMRNVKLGLPMGRQYNIPEKVEALAIFHFDQSNQRGENILQMLHYILYGGDEADLPNRIWEGIKDPNRKIEHFGLSALGELSGWAMPEKYPPRNRRTSKALRSLGYNVLVH